MSLNNRQQAFVQEYLIDLNASAAYLRAGYKTGNPDVCGPALLGKIGISEAVAEALKLRARRTEITADRVVQELARVGFADHSEVVEFVNGKVIIKDTKDITEDARRSISELSESITENGRTRKVRFHDKVRALELLGRHTGAFDADSGEEKPAPVNVTVKVVDGRKA